MRYLDLLADAPAKLLPAKWEDPGFYPGDSPRSRQVRNLLKALSAEVSETSPAGIGLWPPLGSVVDAPANWLFDTAAQYIEEQADREDVLRAVREVRHAWWEAAALFKQAGGSAAMEQAA